MLDKNLLISQKVFLSVTLLISLFSAYFHSILVADSGVHTYEAVVVLAGMFSPIPIIICLLNIRTGRWVLWSYVIVIHILISLLGWPRWYAPIFALVSDWWVVAAAIVVNWFVWIQSKANDSV
jgi:hypothetical protein